MESMRNERPKEKGRRREGEREGGRGHPHSPSIRRLLPFTSSRCELGTVKVIDEPEDSASARSPGSVWEERATLTRDGVSLVRVTCAVGSAHC